MRALLKPVVHLLKWPVRAGAFVVGFMHHLAAFFAWIWMGVHVVGTLAQAGLQAGRLWETRILEDVWRDGLAYFTAAGGLEWKKIAALALVPACAVALRNAWAAYEQLHAWVHEHRHHASQPPVPPPVAVP